MPSKLHQSYVMRTAGFLNTLEQCRASMDCLAMASIWCCSGDSTLEDAFLVGLSVGAGSPAIGRSLAEAGLRGLDGLYLTSVKRSATVIHAVGPDFIVMRDDVLFFAGELAGVKAVAQRFRLRLVTDAFEEDLPALMGSPQTMGTMRTPFQADAEPPIVARPSSVHVSKLSRPPVSNPSRHAQGTSSLTTHACTVRGLMATCCGGCRRLRTLLRLAHPVQRRTEVHDLVVGLKTKTLNVFAAASHLGLSIILRGMWLLLQADSSLALLAADATAQSEIARQSAAPPLQLMRARVAKDAPDLRNVTVRCGRSWP